MHTKKASAFTLGARIQPSVFAWPARPRRHDAQALPVPDSRPARRGLEIPLRPGLHKHGLQTAATGPSYSWGTMSPMVGTPPGASALKFPLELSTLWRSSSVGSETDVVQDSPSLPAPPRNTYLPAFKKQPLWSLLRASPLHLWTHLPYIAPALPTYPCLHTDLSPATLKLVGN